MAVLALVLAVVALVVRTQPISHLLALLAAVGSPYTPFVAVVGLALSVLSRRILLSIIAIVVVGTTLAVQVTWYYSGSSADVGRHTELRVLSSNLRKGQADPPSFVRLAKEYADVIAVSELTPEEASRFSGAGLSEVFPYAMLAPAPDAGGIGLWSRFPLTQLSPTTYQKSGFAAARLRIPGVRFEPLMVSLHITSPVTAEAGSLRRWRTGIADAKANFDNFAEAAGPAAVIVAGDFNSTPDMRQFRALLTNGYRDAVEQTGAGFDPTFPSNKWFPPALVIDHVLTRNAAAASIRTVDIPGSDHRALLATIKVPLDPKPS